LSQQRVICPNSHPHSIIVHVESGIPFRAVNNYRVHSKLPLWETLALFPSNFHKFKLTSVARKLAVPIKFQNVIT